MTNDKCGTQVHKHEREIINKSPNTQLKIYSTKFIHNYLLCLNFPASFPNSKNYHVPVVF